MNCVCNQIDPNRRTGKSTRRIFEAFSIAPYKEVFYICENSEHAKYMSAMAIQMLDHLGFEYIFNKSGLILTPKYGAEIHFITRTKLDERGFTLRGRILIWDIHE